MRLRTDPRTDLELVDAHHAGDPLAVPILLARHHALLERTAYLIVRDHQRAEDVVQEVALRTWRGLPESFGAPEQLRTWLFTTARNVAFDVYRSDGRRAQVARFAMTEQVVDDGTPTVPDHGDAFVERLHLEATVRTALSQLRDVDQRATVVRVDLLEQTAERVAMDMGAPVATVRTRLHRGRQKLRRILAEVGV